MKLLYMFLLMLPLSFVPVNAEDPIDRTAELIRQGNIHELAGSFAAHVDLTIMGEENTYPGTRAEQLLSDFFKINQPRSVKILHRITSNANYRFAVVLVTTSNGVYRTSFSLKNSQGRFELNELRIEAEKTK